MSSLFFLKVVLNFRRETIFQNMDGKIHRENEEILK